MQGNLLRKTEEFKRQNLKNDTKDFEEIQKKTLQRFSAEQLYLAELTAAFTKKLQEEQEKQKQEEQPKQK